MLTVDPQNIGVWIIENAMSMSNAVSISNHSLFDLSFYYGIKTQKPYRKVVSNNDIDNNYLNNPKKSFGDDGI